MVRQKSLVLNHANSLVKIARQCLIIWCKGIVTRNTHYITGPHQAIGDEITVVLLTLQKDVLITRLKMIFIYFSNIS